MLDISDLGLGDTATVRDLRPPEGVEIVDDLDEVLCSVLSPRKAEAALEEIEEATAAAAEPEVLGKPQEGAPEG